MSKMYNIIINPDTRENVSINSKAGKQIINKYNKGIYTKIVNPDTSRLVSVNGNAGKKVLKQYNQYRPNMINTYSTMRSLNNVKHVHFSLIKPKLLQLPSTTLSLQKSMIECSKCSKCNKCKGVYKCNCATKCKCKKVNVDKLLKSVYKEVNGYQITPKEKTLVDTNGSAVYGEITYQGINTLRKNIKFKKDDVFYDLGSGTGKVCLQIALQEQIYSVKGIELSSTRHSHAINALKKIKSQNINLLSDIEFIEQDMTEVDLSDATIVYLNSVCYNGESMKKLHDMFSDLNKLPKLHTIITFQDFSGPPSGFTNKKEIKVKCTWSTSVSIHIYTK
jgi:DNA replication protein DnaC